MILAQLNELIAEVCPIDGINSDGVIFFKAEATTEQRAAAQALMEANLPSLGETDAEQEKRAQRKALADRMAASGVWDIVLYVVMDSFIRLARENYPAETACMSNDDIIAVTVNPASPYYDPDAKKVYDSYVEMKSI